MKEICHEPKYLISAGAKEMHRDLLKLVMDYLYSQMDEDKTLPCGEVNICVLENPNWDPNWRNNKE